jgi:hypothetical protein
MRVGEGWALRPEDRNMAKGQQKSNKEIRKPKKEQPKTTAAQPSRGTVSDIKNR